MDLPGYGYARKSKDRRDQFASLISEYISDREQLQHLFFLVDAMILTSSKSGTGKSEALAVIRKSIG